VSAFATIDESLPSVQAELLDIKTQKTLRTADGGRIEQIPYGLYRLRVWAAGFYSVEQDLRVHQSKLGVRVQLVLVHRPVSSFSYLPCPFAASAVWDGLPGTP
jgi:hypothetical protein